MRSDDGKSSGKLVRGFGAFYLLVGLVLFCIFLVYIWNYTVDDAYISFRYAAHLAEGHGLVWNIGESPVEGYTNFLWVALAALVHLLKFDPEVSAKIIGLVALIGIIYLLWRIASDIFQGNKALVCIGFCASVAFLLANPATALHAVAGLETMLYTASLLGIVYLAYRAIRQPKKTTGWLFGILALICSLARPEGILVSIALITLIYILTRQRGRLERGRNPLLFPLILSYLMPIVAYMLFRVFYFHELFPLPFYAKSTGILNALPALLDAGMYIAPFVFVMLIAIFQHLIWKGKGEGEQNARYRTLLVVAIVTILFANAVYLFSSLWMNYAQRFYYPSFVIIYILAGISVAMLFDKIRAQSTNGAILKRSVHLIGCTLVILLLLSANITFMGDLRIRHALSERSWILHALGESLSSFSNANLTVASIDAGKMPYSSEWHHLDMVGLNDCFIAKNGHATLEYVEGKNPQLVIFYSLDGILLDPRHQAFQAPFMEFVKKKQYAELPPVQFYRRTQFWPYLDPTLSEFDDIKDAIQRVSELSLENSKSP